MKNIRTIRFRDEEQALRHLVVDAEKFVHPDVVYHEVRKAEKEAIRILVTEMIIYAEQLPYEKNIRAEAIKEALFAQIVNGVIPHDILDDDLKNHLNNLGNAYDKKEKEYLKLRKENSELKQRLEDFGRKIPRRNVAENNTEDEECDSERLDTAQLIILFEALLNVPLDATYTNISALSKLIANVSGYKDGAVRAKINQKAKGDYDNAKAKRDAALLIELLKSIDKKNELRVVSRLKENFGM